MTKKIQNSFTTKLKKINNPAFYGAAGILAAAMLASPVHAQGEEAELEEVFVYGIRDALGRAMDTKRSSAASVDAISAEDIGKFPDKNVAESLQRIPGVTIQRQFGEGAAVSIRGAGADLTLTTLNGQNVASTGWFVLEPAKRSFNYELLPSELVGGLEVYKSSQADLLEGGVGGTVVVKTRRPLDLESGTAYASIEASYGDDSGETDPLASALYSFKNESETFGMLVSGVYQKRSMERKGSEAFWEWGAGPVSFNQERERSAISAAFQFAPTENMDFTLNVVDMQMEANNTNYALWLTQGDVTWSGNTPAATLGNTAIAGVLNTGFYQARPREASMNSDVIDLDFNYRGEGYRVHAQVGRTESTGGTDFEAVFDDGVNTPIVGGTYDFRGGELAWSLPNGIAGQSTANYNPGSLVIGTGASFNSTPKTDEESYFQADVEFDVELGAINSIKVGARSGDHETTSRQFFLGVRDGASTRLDISGLTGSINAGGNDLGILNVPSDLLFNFARSIHDGTRTEDLGSSRNINETNNAIYAMATFEGDKLRGNFGVRYVETDAESIYYIDGQRLTESGDYSELLPSVNFAYDMNDEVVLRASAARVIARPQYADMYYNPDVRGANDDLGRNQFYILGSPDLDPYTSDQVDLGVEWYFADDSLLSFTLFHKDVKNFVTFSDRTNVPTASLPSPGFGGVLRDNELLWTVQTKSGNTSASIKGFEFQYQQAWDNGFGFIANYTYTDAEADTAETFTDGNLALSDSSKNSFNISGYYENDKISARLSYNSRSEYMLREAGSYGNRLHDGYASLDFSSSYHLTENIDIKFDVVNITGEDSAQFGNNAVETNHSGFQDGFPTYQYQLPTRVSLGVSFKF